MFWRAFCCIGKVVYFLAYCRSHKLSLVVDSYPQKERFAAARKPLLIEV